jgi:FlaG/FlaF family flagellin (archaellin)
MAIAVMLAGRLVTLIFPTFHFALGHLIDSAAHRVNSRKAFQEEPPWTMTTFPAAATMSSRR